MNTILLNNLNFSRRVYSKLFGSRYLDFNPPIDCSGQSASNLIKARILDDKPLMISRFGNVELEVILTYFFSRKNNFIKYIHYITGHCKTFWWDNAKMEAFFYNAAFFPKNDYKLVEKFCQLYLEAMPEIDILGSWLPDENYLKNYLKNACKIKLNDIEPYNHTTPWSEALYNKKVLVIHPFKESIEKQYAKRELLFPNTNILPKFDLQIIKAPFSLDGNPPDNYKTWFDAYDDILLKIKHCEFDIAILGCGGYGLPLAYEIKKMGKKAIHMGGATQILFGIRGKRWESFQNIASLFNEHWSKPLSSETPNYILKTDQNAYF